MRCHANVTAHCKSKVSRCSTINIKQVSTCLIFISPLTPCCSEVYNYILILPPQTFKSINVPRFVGVIKQQTKSSQSFNIIKQVSRKPKARRALTLLTPCKHPRRGAPLGAPTPRAMVLRRCTPTPTKNQFEKLVQSEKLAIANSPNSPTKKFRRHCFAV